MEQQIKIIRESLEKIKDITDGNVVLGEDYFNETDFIGELSDKALQALAELEQPKTTWEDRDDELTSEIDKFHPLKTGDHETRALANKLVGNRHSKGALVDLVNYLLKQKPVKQSVDSVDEDCKICGAKWVSEPLRTPTGSTITPKLMWHKEGCPNKPTSVEQPVNSGSEDLIKKLEQMLGGDENGVDIERYLLVKYVTKAKALFKECIKELSQVKPSVSEVENDK